MFLAIALVSAHACAWGEEGHQIVGALAMTRLSPQARAAIIELLGDDDLAKAGLWADQIRGDSSYDWAKPLHYVNVPRDAQGVEMFRDCPTNECVIAAIPRFLRVAADKTKPIDERREALKFAVHFMGDLHQPLHAGYKDDLGGNRITLTDPKDARTNLHSVWDTVIIRQHTNGDWRAMAKALEARVTPSEAQQYESNLDPVEWANESQAITRAIYANLPADGKVSSEYCATNLPTVEARLTSAGVRMAASLNKAFEKFVPADSKSSGN